MTKHKALVLVDARGVFAYETDIGRIYPAESIADASFYSNRIDAESAIETNVALGFIAKNELIIKKVEIIVK